MKNLLQVFINDAGELDFRSDNDQWLEENCQLDNPKQSEKFFKGILSKMIHYIWKEKRSGICRIIRVLSMTEMCACAEPYAQAEEFWAMMMFNFIPNFERYSDSLKKKYGYKPESKQRPVVFGDASFFGNGLPKDLS